MTRRFRAFTLIETIAVMVILGTLSAVFSTVLYSATDGYTDAAKTRRTTFAAAAALERMNAGLRSVEPSENSSTLLVAATPQRLEFSSGLIFEFADDELSMTLPDAPEAVILSGCTGQFRIFGDGPAGDQELAFAGTGSFESVRLIGVTITIDGRSISSRVLLRNAEGGGL